MSTHAQKKQINWISFEQLEDSLAVKPKKLLISFYADWCSYCKKMDKVAYQDPKVISMVNQEYYAVKMNAESTDTIAFEGKKFYNEELGKKRNPIHQIPLLLASRKGYPFSLPVTLILDEQFQVKRREFQYVSAKKMVRILK
jgi:thioredoxin-related protein